MILAGHRIKEFGLIEPHWERKVFNGKSYGAGPAGYDVRIAQDFLLWPGRFVLGSTIEKFDMPTNLLAKVCDKSSWARKGISVFNTVIEPGWRGYLTLEIKNQGWSFIRLQAGEPIAQVIFHAIEEPVLKPYNGKYQDQPNRPVAAIEET